MKRFAYSGSLTFNSGLPHNYVWALAIDAQGE